MTVLKCTALFKLTNECRKAVYGNICRYAEIVKGSVGRIFGFREANMA